MLSLATKFIPERTAFETALASGFRAAEFWLDPALLERADEIADTATDFPFRYALHFPNHGPITESTLKSTEALYRRLNCTAIVIHQPMFDRHAAAIREIAPNLVLAVENHILDSDGFESWASRNPGLTLDVEHLWKFTLKDSPLSQLLDRVDEFLDRYAHKLHHVHLPGYHPGGEEHCPSSFHAEMVTQVMTRFASHGFSKLVVSELDLPFQTLEYLQRDVAMFDGWIVSQT